jgi:hypothetical protein
MESDSVSTIAILKEVITKLATARKVCVCASVAVPVCIQVPRAAVDVCHAARGNGLMCARALQVRLAIKVDVKEETIASFLRLVHPLLEHTLSLERKVALIESLQVIAPAPVLCARPGTRDMCRARLQRRRKSSSRSRTSPSCRQSTRT